MKNFIIANYSINSLAVIKWAKDNIHRDFCVLSVDTGFQAHGWDDYLQKVFLWLDKINIRYFHLKPENSFSEMVMARKQFPSQKFSWCASFIKGITILDKIEELDDDGDGLIYLPHRKSMSMISQRLSKHAYNEEKYDDRNIIYPLIDMTDEQIKSYISDIPLNKFYTRSLECQPCIHMTKDEAKNIDNKDIQKVFHIEKSIGANMFYNDNISKLDIDKLPNTDIIIEMSKVCSWEYSCGL